MFISTAIAGETGALYHLQRKNGNTSTKNSTIFFGRSFDAPVDVVVKQFEDRPSFERESVVMSLFEESGGHPNIVLPLDRGILEGKPYMVFPNAGKPLDDVIDVTSLTLNDVVSIIEDVAAATNYAAGHGVFQWDYKLANILLKDRTVFIDWGHVHHESIPLEKNTILGTAGFLSPELIRGENPPDMRSSVYGLGMVAYSLFHGRPPLDIGQSCLQLIHDTLKKESRPLSKTQGVPISISDVVQKAIAYKRTDRYGTVDEFVGALRSAVQDHIELRKELGTEGLSPYKDPVPLRPEMKVQTNPIGPRIIYGLN